jgi:hypothetical protein
MKKPANYKLKLDNMKPILFVLFAVLLGSTGYTQSYDVVYNGGKMYYTMTNDNFDKMQEKSFARDVTVNYDSFFKTYYLILTTAEGWTDMKFTYIRTEDNELNYFKNVDDKTTWLVADAMSENGLILLKSTEKQENGLYSVFVVKELVLVKPE